MEQMVRRMFHIIKNVPKFNVVNFSWLRKPIEHHIFNKFIL